MEHTSDPVSTLRDVASFLDQSGVLIFTTGIQPYDIGHVRAGWWYIAPRNGHLSIFSEPSLAEAGRRASLTIISSPE
jgi:2-polyprenyl-6-hydroxyphenyl methylase/3-demethylubiquinone-9 3-methyltransferase